MFTEGLGTLLPEEATRARLKKAKQFLAARGRCCEAALRQQRPTKKLKPGKQLDSAAPLLFSLCNLKTRMLPEKEELVSKQAFRVGQASLAEGDKFDSKPISRPWTNIGNIQSG